MAETKIKASQTDLIGGRNITLTPKYSEGGIDVNTLVLFDFEQQSFANTGKGPLTMVNTPSSSFFTDTTKKFGNYCFATLNSGAGFSFIPKSSNVNWSSDFTIDFWIKSLGYNDTYITALTGDPIILPYGVGVLWRSIYRELKFNFNGAQTTIATSVDLTDTFHHFAMCCSLSNKTISVFLDGEKKYTYTHNADIPLFNTVMCNTNSANSMDGVFGTLIDEYRFSNTVRYDGNFTPPTEAYTVASLLGTAINCPSDVLLKSVSGYDGTKAQSLQHDSSGNLSWVDIS